METLTDIFSLAVPNPYYERDIGNAFISLPNRILFIIGGSIVAVATFFLMLGAFKFKELRRQPGDLVLGVAFFDFCLALHWITLAIFGGSGPIDPESSFCKLNGAFGSLAGIGEYLYNVFFSAFLVESMRNALKQDKIPKKTFHVLGIAGSIGITLGLLGMNKIGKTYAGTCSLKSPRDPDSVTSLFGPIIAFSYAVVGGFTYRYIKKNAPKCATAHSKRSEFLIYYNRYIKFASFIFLAIAGLNFWTLKNGALEEDWTHKVEESFSKAAVTFAFNFSKLCSPLVLSFIRYKDPLITKYMKKTIFFWKKEEPKRGLEQGLVNGDESTETPDLEAQDDEFILNALSADKRKEMVYTLLSCVLFADHTQRNAGNSSRKDEVQFVEKHPKHQYKHRKTYQINDSISTNIPAIQNALETNRVSILAGSFKVVAPELFMRFINEDAEYLNIQESLDLTTNSEQILDASGPGGGKSGEFFFFSKDKKLIIKTIPDVEMNEVGKMLEKYEQHFKENPDSLIAKLYGAYTFASTEIGEKFNLIIMKNLNGIPSKYVEKAYDMKGSRYDRELLKGKPGYDKDFVAGRCMKDLDFEKIERKLFIRPELKQQFLNQIDNDSLFFKKVKLIDYSIMVFVIDKGQYRRDMEELAKNSDGSKVPNDRFVAKNKLGVLENTEEPGIEYHVGIVDYLQPYTWGKFFEKVTKKVTKGNINLDTSSQDPKYYSERFIRFMHKIVE